MSTIDIGYSANLGGDLTEILLADDIQPGSEGRRHYVYMYFRPDETPCYVGMGTGRRWRQHLTRKTNAHLNAIIAKAGGLVPVKILRRAMTKAEACELEMAIIAALGREVDGGILVNYTFGGDGGKGCSRPKSPDHRRKIGEGNKGRVQSVETRRKISERNIGRVVPPEFVEHLRRIAKNRKRNPCSEETKEKIRLAHVGKAIGDETRQKMSAAHLGRKQSPEWVAKRVASRLKTIGTQRECRP